MSETEREDRGADGPAMLARPRRIMEWQRKITPTRSVTERREVMADVLMLDKLAGEGIISYRQHQAAQRMYGLFLAAGLTPHPVGKLDYLREEAAEDDEAGELPETEARAVYRRLLIDLGPNRGPVVDGLMHEQVTLWRLGVLRNGLDQLADWWGMERQSAAADIRPNSHW